MTGVDAVTVLRAFNRSHTRRIGALDDSFLQSGRPLALARLLFEIGHDGVSVLELRRRLGLDSGYLSRMLRELEHDGLVVVTPDPDDGRRRIVELTAPGRIAWSDLDRRSDEFTRSLLHPLTDRQRTDLDTALRTADRLLRAADIRFEVVDPRSPGALSSMNAYFAELTMRFPDGFESGDTLRADAPAMRAPTGAFVVARSDDRTVACGGILRHADDTAEIKRMWVDLEWRGLGLGRRMLARLEEEIARLGYTRIVLDTNGTLTEAIAMYERAGYRSIERYNTNPYATRWFAKNLDPRRDGPSARR
jgi:DNA-binding MarR family transcriptional regulator/N-acetylglutamate synthase-like GNAT family acetyltransferase